MIMKKDRRQINATWYFTNPLGETYQFGQVGSGKKSYIKTLKYVGKNLSKSRLKKLGL